MMEFARRKDRLIYNGNLVSDFIERSLELKDTAIQAKETLARDRVIDCLQNESRFRRDQIKQLILNNPTLVIPEFEEIDFDTDSTSRF